MKRIVIPAVAGVLLVFLLALFFLTVRVPADTLALLESEGAASVLQPGFHVRPLGSSITEYSTRSVSPTTSVQLEVPPIGTITLSLTVTGSPDPRHLERLHRSLEGRSIEDLLRESAGTALERAASGLDPVQLLSSEFRSQAQASIVEVIEKGAGLTGVAATIHQPEESIFLDAAMALAPQREGWRLRQAVSEAIDLKEGRAGWKLTTAMGFIDESEKLFSEAERNYLDALSIDPAALPPMTQLIGLYTPAGQWEKLARILDAALLANPDSLQHITWMAMALLKTGDLPGAEQVLEHGLEVAPDSAIVLANLGGVYLKQNRFDEALELLERAIQAEPSSPQALFNLGSALASMDRFENAVEYLERAEQAGSRSPQLFATLAIVHRRLGNLERGDHYDRLAAAAR